MTTEERAEIARKAKEAAAAMPPLTDEQVEKIAALLLMARPKNDAE